MRANVVLMAMVLGSASAAGQTRFMWPDTAVDLSRYTTVEECLGAISRISNGMDEYIRRASGVLRDTVPYDPAEMREPLPSEAVEMARRCGGRFAGAESVPLADFAPIVRLYLGAGWDDKVRLLVNRRFSAIAPASNRERTAVIDSLIRDHMNARPARLALVDSLLERVPAASNAVQRAVAHIRVMFVALDARDSARALSAAQQVLGISDSLSVSQRDSVRAQAQGNIAVPLVRVIAVRMATRREVVLDSLRKSTAAFVNLQRTLWARATLERPEAFRGPIGARAPRLVGIQGGTPRPIPGRVNLVVFMSHDLCMRIRSEDQLAENCWTAHAMMRRLAARFPELAITIVVPTHGFFSYLEPVALAAEAKQIEQWLAWHRTPGTLVVLSTDFFRLPAPDRRRIDRSVGDVANYTFGGSWPLLDNNETGAFLVDRDETIVHATNGRIQRKDELELAELIEILLRRRAVIPQSSQ